MQSVCNKSQYEQIEADVKRLRYKRLLYVSVLHIMILLRFNNGGKTWII
jgi:hypothetical protein